MAGQTIDPAEGEAFAAPAAIVIAHNSAFDRRFLERFCEVFATKAWACSMTQIEWSTEGYEGTKLAYLATAAGFFYERHRAVHDCLATIELLALPLRVAGGTALGQLLSGTFADVANLGGKLALRTEGPVEGSRLPLEW